MKPLSEIDAPSFDNAADNPVAGIDQSVGDFKYDIKYEFDAGTGLNENTVRYISAVKKEASVSGFPMRPMAKARSAPCCAYVRM